MLEGAFVRSGYSRTKCKQQQNGLFPQFWPGGVSGCSTNLIVRDSIPIERVVWTVSRLRLKDNITVLFQLIRCKQVFCCNTLETILSIITVLWLTYRWTRSLQGLLSPEGRLNNGLPARPSPWCYQSKEKRGLEETQE